MYEPWIRIQPAPRPGAPAPRAFRLFMYPVRRRDPALGVARRQAAAYRARGVSVIGSGADPLPAS